MVTRNSRPVEPLPKEHYNWSGLFIGLAVVGAFLIGLSLGSASRPAPVNVTDDDSANKSSKDTVNADINRKNRMVMGDRNAPVKIIEYADPLCPYCTKFAMQSEPKLREYYIDTGKVEFEYRAVAMIAPSSQRAVESMHCALDQDKFWPYLDHIQQQISHEYNSGKSGKDITMFDSGQIGALGSAVGLDEAKFTECVESGKFKGEVVMDTSRATSSGVTGTPTFYIGGERYAASSDFDVMEAVIKAKL